MNKEPLIQEAREARNDSYSPYSEFNVGAVIQCADGSRYTGANIENINYTNTTHAEENAINKAVLDGKREFTAIAISLSGDPIPPCGMCRQSLSEFCDDDFVVIVDEWGETTLGELFPSGMENID
jgi:cytidine deaminase